MKTTPPNKKELLSSKLLAYSAAAGAMLALGSDAKGQIVYTDVDPDSTLQGETGAKGIYELDINNDGTIDLQIIQGNGDWYSGWNSVRVKPQNDGAVVTSAIYFSAWNNSYNMGVKLDKDAVIDSNLNFNGSTYYSIQLGWQGSSLTSGPWVGETDKYLGVRISLDGGTTFHYGWVRLDVAADLKSFTVKDYAYEETAGVAIEAGDTGTTSVKDLFSGENGLNAYTVGKSIRIENSSPEEASVQVYSVLGKLVHNSRINAGRNEIIMEQSGLYIVKVVVENQEFSGKIVIL